MIIWIHGAYSTSEAFNYFRLNSWGSECLIEYDVSGSPNLQHVCNDIKKKISSISKEPVDIVGHSLGGFIGVVMEKQGLPVRSIVTMASPFGGIGTFWPPKTIGFEMARMSKFMKAPPKAKHQFYVATTGHNPWLIVKNDGVVPLSSQKAIPDANYVNVEADHFGILMNDKVVDGIRKFHSEL